MEHRTKPTLAAEGDYITFRAGRATIVLQRTVQTFTVTVHHGNKRMDDLCATWDNEADARTHARGLAQIYLDEERATVLAKLDKPMPTTRVSKPGVGLIGYITEPVFRALQVADRDGKVFRGLTADDRAPRAVLASAEKDGLLALTPQPGTRAGNHWYGELTAAGELVLAGELARRAREAKVGAR